MLYSGFNSGTTRFDQNFISNHSTIKQQVEEDFFPFGRDRQRLKSYVQEQLNGEEVRKNQRILVQFQKKASLHKHNHLSKHRYSDQLTSSNVQPYPKLYTIEQEIPTQTIQFKSFKSRFANYMPRSPPLQPTEKKKPPAYNYYNILPYRGFEKRKSDSRIQDSQPKLTELYRKDIKSVNTPQPTPMKIMVRNKKGNSLDIKENGPNNHRAWALRNIKEIANKKKVNEKNQITTDCSSGSSVIQELQQREKQSKMQFKRLARQLKRLKKYRKYITELENKTKPF